MTKIFTRLCTPRHWLPLLALLTLAGRAAAQQPALGGLPSAPAPAVEELPQPKLTTLPAANGYRLTAIRIDDTRTTASERTIKLPAFSTPGRGDKVWPLLTAEQRAQIQAALQAHFPADSTRPAATLQCRIIDAYQLFMPTAQKVIVAGYAQIEVELLDSQGELLMAATGQRYEMKTGLGAGYKGLDECYQKALADAVRSALAHLTMPAE